MFEIYTYFGRVLFRSKIEENELYHPAYERAYAFAIKWERETGKKCWLRYRK